jgi:hypothetical protein
MLWQEHTSTHTSVCTRTSLFLNMVYALAGTYKHTHKRMHTYQLVLKYGECFGQEHAKYKHKRMHTRTSLFLNTVNALARNMAALSNRWSRLQVQGSTLNLSHKSLYTQRPLEHGSSVQQVVLSAGTRKHIEPLEHGSSVHQWSRLQVHGSTLNLSHKSLLHKPLEITGAS